MCICLVAKFIIARVTRCCCVCVLNGRVISTWPGVGGGGAGEAPEGEGAARPTLAVTLPAYPGNRSHAPTQIDFCLRHFFHLEPVANVERKYVCTFHFIRLSGVYTYILRVPRVDLAAIIHPLPQCVGGEIFNFRYPGSILFSPILE